MTRLFTLLLAAIVLPMSAADGKGYGSFPALRVQNDAFLKPEFRLPIESLLMVDSPAELAKLASGGVPTFAAAPVVGRAVNPFAALKDSPARNGSPEAAINEGLASDPFASSSPDDSSSDDDPFGAAGPSDDDPFASDAFTSDSSNPFATPSGEPSGDSGDNPFAGADDDDPFGDF